MPGPATTDAIQTLLALAGLPQTILTSKVAAEYIRDFVPIPGSSKFDVETIRRALPVMVSIALERSLRAVERVT